MPEHQGSMERAHKETARKINSLGEKRHDANPREEHRKRSGSTSKPRRRNTILTQDTTHIRMQMAGAAALAKTVSGDQDLLQKIKKVVDGTQEDLSQLKVRQHALGLGVMPNARPLCTHPPQSRSRSEANSWLNLPPPPPFMESMMGTGSSLADLLPPPSYSFVFGSPEADAEIDVDTAIDDDGDDFFPLPVAHATTCPQFSSLASWGTPGQSCEGPIHLNGSRSGGYDVGRRDSNKGTSPPSYHSKMLSCTGFHLPIWDAGAPRSIAAFPSSSRDTQPMTASSLPGWWLKASEAPMSPEDCDAADVAIEALRFATVTRNLARMKKRFDDLMHTFLSGMMRIEYDERAARHRLRLAECEVMEHVKRHAVLYGYYKFVVFCMKNEPVWRRAARELQEVNEQTLQATVNMYACLALQEVAEAAKLEFYRQASDYVTSLKFLEQDYLAEACERARRRRQSESVMQPRSPQPVQTHSSHRPHEPRQHPQHEAQLQHMRHRMQQQELRPRTPQGPRHQGRLRSSEYTGVRDAPNIRRGGAVRQRAPDPTRPMPVPAFSSEEQARPVAR